MIKFLMPKKKLLKDNLVILRGKTGERKKTRQKYFVDVFS